MPERKIIQRRGKRLQVKVRFILAEKVNLTSSGEGAQACLSGREKPKAPKSCTVTTPAGRALCISKEPQESHSKVNERQSVRGDAKEWRGEGLGLPV